MSRARTELQQLTIDGGHEVVAILDKQPTWGGRRKGAGRKISTEPTVTISFRISSRLARFLGVIADGQGATLSATAKKLMLERMEEPGVTPDYLTDEDGMVITF